MPLPRFVQRLFQNDGYGPKLRSEIIPWDDEKRFTALEAWRQAMIGTPMPMAGTTLPPGFMWADGSFASFAAYPELKAKYDAGGFTGMLLAYNASEEDIAAYPGKFKPDAANPTGLFAPRLNGLFARYCGQGEQAGAYHRDEMRNVYGSFDPRVDAINMTGAFYYAGAAARHSVSGSENGGVVIGFDTSRVVPTGPENVPPHYGQSIALYLGRSAQV